MNLWQIQALKVQYRKSHHKQECVNEPLVINLILFVLFRSSYERGRSYSRSPEEYSRYTRFQKVRTFQYCLQLSFILETDKLFEIWMNLTLRSPRRNNRWSERYSRTPEVNRRRSYDDRYSRYELPQPRDYSKSLDCFFKRGNVFHNYKKVKLL